MAQGFGKKIAEIAYENGLGELEIGVNIFAMSRIENGNCTPPGKHFIAKFELIVSVANERLISLWQSDSTIQFWRCDQQGQ
jgi:hypothetical protein